MARTDNLTHFLTDVASAIKTKKGSQESIQASNFDTEIANLPSGGKYAPSYVSFAYYQGDDLSDELSNLDTSNITTMLGMFDGCTNLTSLNLSGFNTSNVEDMNNMFSGCTSLTSLDLSSFNTSNVKDMNNMFSSCTNLAELNLSSFNTSNVTTMFGMFMEIGNLTSLNLSNFDFSNVEQMDSMLSSCGNLETITFPDNISLDNIITMDVMFESTTNLDTTTLNQILHMCTTVGEHYQGEKTLEYLGITSDFVNYDEIPNLSNYQDFLDAGWTLMAE